MHKLVHVDWQEEDGRFGTDYYGYNRKNKLARLFRYSHTEFVDKDGSQKVKRVVYATQGRRTVKKRVETILPDQVGEISEDMIEGIELQRQRIKDVVRQQ